MGLPDFRDTGLDRIENIEQHAAALTDVGSGSVASVTAGDATVTIGGTAANPTVKVTGSTFQPLDSDLTAIAALSTTAYGRALLALADAAALQTAGGLVIGTNVEAHDADLTTIAGLTATNDDVIQRKAGAWTNRTVAQLLTDLAAPGTTFQPLDSDLTAIAALATTSFGRSVLAAADAAALRTLAGAVIGTNVQAWDADLDALATLTSAADKLPYATGAQAWALTSLSSFIRTVLDDADAVTARATLGVIASLFQSGGAQALALDTLAATTDIATLNASTSAHGLLKKLDNTAAHYMDGTGAWSTPAGTAFVQLADSTLGGTAASFDLTSIPGGYTSLRLDMQLRCDEVTTDDWGYLRFNNDSGANYDWNGFLAPNASMVFAGASTGQTKAGFSEIMGTTAAAGDAASVSVLIPNYAGTTFHKTFVSRFAGKGSATRVEAGQFIGNWNNTAAITRITLFPTSGNFIAGSRVTLYGVL